MSQSEIKSEPLDLKEESEEYENSVLSACLVKVEIQEDSSSGNLELVSEGVLVKKLLTNSKDRLKLLPKFQKTFKPPNPNEIVCDICNKRFLYYGSYLRHRCSHTQCVDKILCLICHKMISKPAMYYHMNYKHYEARNFKCKLCGRAFKSPGSLKHHQSTQHSNDDDYKYQCQDCKEYFPSVVHHDKHFKTFHGNFLKFKKSLNFNLTP